MAFTEKELAKRLEAESTKDQLLQLWFTPVKNFLFTHRDSVWKGETVATILGKIDLRKNLAKTDLISLCARIYSNQALLKEYVDSGSPQRRVVLELASWVPALDTESLEAIFGKGLVNLKSDKKLYHGNYELELVPALKEWNEFTKVELNVWSYYSISQNDLKNATVTLTLPLLMREVFKAFLPKPKGYDLEPLLVATGKSGFFNAERDILRELPLIIAYYMQGNLKYSQKGYPNLASAGKMQRTLKLKEFDNQNEMTIRSLLIAGILSDDFTAKSITGTPLQALKSLATRDFNNQPAAYYLLTHIKGLNYFNNRDFTKGVTEKIFDILKEVPAASWISFENLKVYISSRGFHVAPIQSYQVYSRVDVELANGDKERSKTSITRNNYNHYMLWPFVAGHIYLLAALGMAEISEDSSLPVRYSYFDRLQAFRITPLGEYLLGKTNQYEPPEQEQLTQLSFDESSPIIRIEGNIELGDAMLANYATKVSENRYQFSPGKFLKDCKTGKDLETKITLFRQTVGKKLPLFWDSYLQNLVDNSKAIKEQKKVVVYTLPSTHKDLHRVIAQDEVLRSIVIKAEQYIIIVSDDKNEAFTNRMKELGYLVE
ncbi:MAG: hypothetical protein INR73_06040 [Williamsia sp.]|nr:hypothetical protein [Williamsia sp.]